MLLAYPHVASSFENASRVYSKLKLSDRHEQKGSGERYTDTHSTDCAAKRSVCVPFMSADE